MAGNGARFMFTACWKMIDSLEFEMVDSVGLILAPRAAPYFEHHSFILGEPLARLAP